MFSKLKELKAQRDALLKEVRAVGCQRANVDRLCDLTGIDATPEMVQDAKELADGQDELEALLLKIGA